MRIIEARFAFKKVQEDFRRKARKSVNEKFIEDVKTFFRCAVLAGYKTAEELH